MTLRTLTHSSPSQVKSARRCVQRWWAEKIAGMPRPDTAALIFGRSCHGQLEKHLVDGIAPHGREGLVLAPALPYFPPAGTVKRIHCETPIRIETGILPVIGYIDHVGRGVVADSSVDDLKTTSDLKYVMEEDELRRDPQCAIYVRALLVDTGAPSSEFRHVYAQTSAPKSTERRILVTRGENDDRWSDVLDTLRLQLQYAGAERMEDVPGNPDACGDYGGCHFRGVCPTWKKRGLNLFGRGLDVKIDFRFPTREDVSKKEDAVALTNVFGTPEEKERLVGELVAAGWDREKAGKMNLPALRAMALQLRDPVNPGDASGEKMPETEGKDGEDDPPEKEKPNGKAHWKAARTELARLTGTTLDAVSAMVKEKSWSTEDVVAECARLGAGQPPAPKAVVGEDVTIEIVAGTRVHDMILSESRMTAVVEELGITINSDGPVARLLEKVKAVVEATLGRGVIFRPKPRQRDPVPVTRDPPVTVRDPVVAPAPTEPPPIVRTKENMPVKEDPLAGRKKSHSVKVGDVDVTFYLGQPPAVSYETPAGRVARFFQEGTGKAAIARAVAEYPNGGSPLDVDPTPVKELVAPDVAEFYAKQEEKAASTSATINQAPGVSEAPRREPFSGKPPDMPGRGAPEAAPIVGAVGQFGSIKQDCVLYVDCVPTWPHVRLEDLLEPLQREVELSLSAAQYYAALPFNDGSKLLAQKLHEKLEKGMVLPTSLYVNSFMPSAWMCVEVLVRRVRGVVRGRG